MKTDIDRAGVIWGNRFRGGPRFWRTLLSTLALCVGLAPGAAAGERPTLVAAGEFHTCVVTSTGKVLCWGSNAYGQLGNNSTTDSPAPVQVSGLTSGVTGVAAGGGDAGGGTNPLQGHTCAVTSGGGLMCWGSNAGGQLGNNSTSDALIPVQVSGLTSGVTAVAAGYSHTCAIASGGELKCWGRNVEGQLGDGTSTTRLTPVSVSGLSSGVVAVAAGYSHTCAITGAGALKCWGSGGNGQLGNGTQSGSLVPAQVTGLTSGVTAVAAGWRFNCAITTGGAAQCWGANLNGQVGVGTKTSYELSPLPVTGLSSGVAALTGGRYHTCAITTGGAILCWGANILGQLGDGTTNEHLTPSPSGLTIGVTKLAAGSRHACAVTAGGAARCWGLNANGQLGNGDTTNRTDPTAVNGLAGWPPRDVDADGKSDLLWRGTAGDLWLWTMNGGTRLSEPYLGTVSDPNWQIRSVGDQDGDGQADILWRHAVTGALYLRRMQGGVPQTDLYVGTVPIAYDIVGTGDFDGDGRTDILWRHATSGDLWAWIMDGATILEDVYAGAVSTAYAVVGLGDLNGDGRCDILWRHSTSGDVWAWVLNDTATPDAIYVTTVWDLGYEVSAVADLTGDGKADIVWRHATQGDVWLWAMNGGTRVSEPYVGTTDPNYRIVAAGDYDGDGKADLLWRHVANGDMWMWLMDGATRLSDTYVGTVPVGYQIVK